MIVCLVTDLAGQGVSVQLLDVRNENDVVLLPEKILELRNVR